MFAINLEEIEKLTGRMAELIECKPELLSGFACSASDNSCHYKNRRYYRFHPSYHHLDRKIP